MSHSRPPSPQEILQDPQVGLTQAPVVTACALGRSARDLVCTLQFRAAPALKPRWPSKPDALGAPPCNTRPQPGEPDVGLRTLL